MKVPSIVRAIILGSSLFGAHSFAASYTLDVASSSLKFVSTKQVHVSETFSAMGLSGGIDEEGAATLTIDLENIETGIVLRNERMRDLLFETNLFKQANVTLNVDIEDVNNLTIGSSVELNVNASLSLRGITGTINTPIIVSKLSATRIMVQNASPILIDGRNYDLATGIDALRDIGSLAVISYIAPVNFTLFFNTL